MSRLQAVLWDFDGTLVDTEPVWAKTEQRIVAEHGVLWSDELMRQKVGQHASITASEISQAVGQPERAAYWYEELHRRVAAQIAHSELPYLPGIRELLAETLAAQLRCAVVTASSGAIIDTVRARLPEGFEFIITADDVTRTKPDPEAYELALVRMGLGADEVVILEDSLPGTQAALATGAVVIAFPVTQVLEAHPRLHVRTQGPAGLTLVELRQIWEELRRR